MIGQSVCLRPLAYLVRSRILCQRIGRNVHARNDTVQAPYIATFVIVMRCHAQHGRGNKVCLNVIQLRLVLICKSIEIIVYSNGKLLKANCTHPRAGHCCVDECTRRRPQWQSAAGCLLLRRLQSPGKLNYADHRQNPWMWALRRWLARLSVEQKFLEKTHNG